MGLFKTKLVDADVADWQLEGYEWLIVNSALHVGLDAETLWLPIPNHFGEPDVKLTGKKLANFILILLRGKCPLGLTR